jgi:hypothetical protein
MSGLPNVTTANGETAPPPERLGAGGERRLAEPRRASRRPSSVAHAARGSNDARRSAGDSDKTLLLVDDLRLRRECLTRLLGAELPNFEIAAVADARSFETWKTAAPDIVVFTASLADAKTRSRVNETVAASAGAPVLLLSDAEIAFADDVAAEWGVAGLVPAACGASVLIAAIQIVLAGGHFHIPARSAAASPRRPGNGEAD